ncbi:glycosyl transferase [Candidatus Methylomirabilis lanthanidiphila]|uniref:Glycosyl transferase n=1 Tax=Candidatus Methylomirabilis lanthanidiphila TaxID=2211376 RepID=A0A564ZIW5_9BACT|nr:glycosyltransferase family 2 protein [Candidatus Methylomirabilis lanthanidiphila]VUZ84478.1 glycosyl transferase [Candidatus Methylomirabilis lanthanidiphila]
MSHAPAGPQSNRDPLTFLIPAYNEEAILRASIDRLRAFLKERDIEQYEIILVSNGSTDRTVEIAEASALGRDDLRVIALDRRGVGRAFKEGIRRAQHDRVICLDLDLTIDLAFIESAAAVLATADIVIGSKQTGAQQRSLFRRLASASFIACTRHLLGLEFTDYSIGAKAYRRSAVISHLPALADGSAYVVQLIAWGHREGAAIAEIPVWCDDRRRSKFNLLHEGLYRFGSLFLLWLQVRTKRDRVARR